MYVYYELRMSEIECDSSPGNEGEKMYIMEIVLDCAHRRCVLVEKAF